MPASQAARGSPAVLCVVAQPVASGTDAHGEKRALRRPFIRSAELGGDNMGRSGDDLSFTRACLRKRFPQGLLEPTGTSGRLLSHLPPLFSPTIACGWEDSSSGPWRSTTITRNISKVWQAEPSGRRSWRPSHERRGERIRTRTPRSSTRANELLHKQTQAPVCKA